MENNEIIFETIKKIDLLGLNYLNNKLTEKLVNISFNSVLSFINTNFNLFFDFNSNKSIIINIIIGEYLFLIKNSNLYLQNKINTDEAIKTISEGDTSITYFQGQSKSQNIDILIDYFLKNKSLLLSFRAIRW